jgi:dihydrofolate reductase
MIISHVVAVADDNAIGGNDGLLWHLPNDLRFFKNTTWGMPVIMGRKTFETLSGKPLAGRTNIVITRDSSLSSSYDNVHFVTSIELAVQKAAEADCKEIFIIGGGEIYKQSIAMVDKIYITRVHGNFSEATVFFPDYENHGFKLVDKISMQKDEKHAFDYDFEVWEKL